MISLGTETPITVDGTPYIIGRVEISVVEAFRDWVKEQEGDPFAGLKELAEFVSPADMKAMVDEARDTRRQLQSFTLGCPLAKRYYGTEIGLTKLYQFMLQKHHPNITANAAFSVALADAGAAIAKGSGDVAGAVGKAPAPAV